jgi:hypothetical protein
MVFVVYEIIRWTRPTAKVVDLLRLCKHIIWNCKPCKRDLNLFVCGTGKDFRIACHFIGVDCCKTLQLDSEFWWRSMVLREFVH